MAVSKDPTGPRTEILSAIRRRLINATAAGERVWLNRTEPIPVNDAGGETPALTIFEVSEAAKKRTSSGPKSYDRTLRISIGVHVPRIEFTAGMHQTGQSLSASESVRRAELCAQVEAALLADPTLETVSGDGRKLTGDVEYVGTQFAQEAANEVAVAVAAIQFDYSYVTVHEHHGTFGAKSFKLAHVDHFTPAPQSAATVSDDIALEGG